MKSSCQNSYWIVKAANGQPADARPIARAGTDLPYSTRITLSREYVNRRCDFELVRTATNDWRSGERVWTKAVSWPMGREAGALIVEMLLDVKERAVVSMRWERAPIADAEHPIDDFALRTELSLLWSMVRRVIAYVDTFGDLLHTDERASLASAVRATFAAIECSDVRAMQEARLTLMTAMPDSTRGLYSRLPMFQARANQISFQNVEYRQVASIRRHTEEQHDQLEESRLDAEVASARNSVMIGMLSAAGGWLIAALHSRVWRRVKRTMSRVRIWFGAAIADLKILLHHLTVVARGERLEIMLFAYPPPQELLVFETIKMMPNGRSVSTHISVAASNRRPYVELTAILTIEGLLVHRGKQRLAWRGELMSTRFLVDVPKSAHEREYEGEIYVSTNDMRFTNIPFAIEVCGSAEQTKECAETTISEHRPYRKAFICYSHADEDIVVSKAQAMRIMNRKMDVYYELQRDRNALYPGDEWEEEIDEMIQGCDIFFLFWSRNAFASNQVRREYRLAIEEARKRGIHKKELICIVPIENVEKEHIPPELAELHFHDLHI